jgi:ATP diphosphatase
VNERWRARRRPRRRRRRRSAACPKTLPALLRAYELSSRAAAVGFDWAKAADVLDKIDEEVAELRREVESGATGDLSRAEDEMGDLLFSIANLSRKLGVEPEAALRRASDKFSARFGQMEAALAARGVSLPDASLTRWKRSGRERSGRSGSRLRAQTERSPLNGAPPQVASHPSST